MTGGNSKVLTGETYIRQLPYSVVKYISLLLDVDRQWEKFVLQIPKRLQDVGKETNDMRYSYLQVRLFEDKGRRPDGSPTKTIMGEAGMFNFLSNFTDIVIRTQIISNSLLLTGSKRKGTFYIGM
jgi:hypothetical protein